MRDELLLQHFPDGRGQLLQLAAQVPEAIHASQVRGQHLLRRVNAFQCPGNIALVQKHLDSGLGVTEAGNFLGTKNRQNRIWILLHGVDPTNPDDFSGRSAIAIFSPNG